MSADNMFSALLKVAAVGVAGYATYKGVQAYGEVKARQDQEEQARQRALARSYAQERAQARVQVEQDIQQLDASIDQLLQAPEEAAIPALLEAVPKMDDTLWHIFAQLLHARAESSTLARGLLALALALRASLDEVNQLLTHSVQEAVAMLADILPHKDHMEVLGFLGALKAKAASDIKAKAILGRLMTALQS